MVLLNEEGNNIRNLVYLPQCWADIFNEDDTIPGYPVQPGWYDEGDYGSDFTTRYDTEPITFGKSIQVNIYSGMPEAGVVFSGAVKKAPTFTDVVDFMSLANCAPKDIKLGQLKVNCDEENLEPTSGWFAGGDTVVLLNEEGNNIRNLVYLPQCWADIFNEDDTIPGYPVQPGWYDEGDYGSDFTTCYNDLVDIPAGEGFQVNAYSGMPDITVQIDSAIAE